VAHAIYTRKQFYPAVIYLATSKFSILVFGNLMFTLVTIMGKAAKSLFFGPLRDIEVEHMYDRSWTALVEMCIAMTIFREEFSVRFVALVTVLFFVKIFHWLTQHRLEYIEQAYPQLGRSTHFRIVSLMLLLMAIDSSFVYLSVSQTLQKGASVLLLFAFEYVVLLSMMMSLFVKYYINVLDMRREGRWNNKGTYVFYLQLVTDLFQLFVYMIFFLIICAYYGLPFHIIRDLYITYSNFKKRITQYLQYRRLTRMLHTFPDVSAEEIAETEDLDSTCIICRDEMTSAKRLHCGHIFHYHCLRTWLEQNNSCPYCRTPITAHRPPTAAAQPANPQAPAAGGLGMPDLQMPPAAAAADGGHHAAVGARMDAHEQGAAAPSTAFVRPEASTGYGTSHYTGVAGVASPGMFNSFPMSQQGLGGMPPISEEMLKVHVEWQIESLQNLLRQIEKRQVERLEMQTEAANVVGHSKPSAGTKPSADAKPSADVKPSANAKPSSDSDDSGAGPDNKKEDNSELDLT